MNGLFYNTCSLIIPTKTIDLYALIIKYVIHIW